MSVIFREGKMDMYAYFAQYYDKLTANVDYQARADYFCEIIRRHYGCKGRLLLDLACGTGNLSYPFAQRGWDVIGVDASEDMLACAVGKLPAFEGGKPPLFLRQRMEALDLFGTVDVCVCALDSINHITEIDLLECVFARLSLFIESGGLLVFDANTPFKHESILSGSTYIYDEKDVYCVWQNSVASGGLVDIDLDFFEKVRGDTYRRYTESFSERAYTTEELSAVGRRTGFQLIGIYTADTFSCPRGDAQRLVYVMENMLEHTTG